MKNLVLCACVLILAFQSSSSSELKNRLKNAVASSLTNDAEACLTENDMTKNDLYGEAEVMNNLHAVPENAERTRKNGCWLACLLKKQNLMEGTNIKEAEVHTKLNAIFNDGIPSVENAIAHKVARKCIKRAKSITQECEKGISLYLCIAETVHELDQHHEHEILEAETEAEEEVVTEQAE